MIADLSVRLKKLRLERGYTQKQVAEAIHISVSSVSQYERGRTQPCRENLIALAELFNVTVAFLEGTSGVEKIETLLNTKCASNITMREVIDMLQQVPMTDRAIVIRVVEALIQSQEKQN